jgi:hypothetical protein
MHRIAIVGAGQAGLPLAFGLLDKGYEVTVVSDRTPDQIRGGKVLSSQCMFGSALQIESDLGIDDWHDLCPPVDGISFSLQSPDPGGGPLIDWKARLDRPARSVDQRIKMAQWLAKLEARGARVLIQKAGVADLEALADTHDLVIVSAGKGDVAQLFERDALRSTFDAPQRALSLTYVHGLKEADDYSRISFNVIPSVGEYFVIPALTLSGPCHIMFFEGIPQGPFDIWRDALTPGDHLDAAKRLLRTWLPREADRAKRAELTDAHGILAGAFAPVVRKPVLQLPSGRPVFGLGDAVAINDPISGQGSSSATHACKVYLDAILAHGDAPFTRDWMEQTFEQYWTYAEAVTQWTNSLLMPPPQYRLKLLDAAVRSPAIASAIVNGFDDPPSFFPWWSDAEACERFIAERQDSVPNAPASPDLQRDGMNQRFATP